MDEFPELVNKSKEYDHSLYARPIKPVQWGLEDIERWKELGNSSGERVPDPILVRLANTHNTLFSPSCTLENHCAIYSFGLTIKNNGDVQICPDHHESRLKFGNVRDEPLSEILAKLNSQRTIKSGFCVMLPDIKH